MLASSTARPSQPSRWGRGFIWIEKICPWSFPPLSLCPGCSPRGRAPCRSPAQSWSISSFQKPLLPLWPHRGSARRSPRVPSPSISDERPGKQTRGPWARPRGVLGSTAPTEGRDTPSPRCSPWPAIAAVVARLALMPAFPIPGKQCTPGRKPPPHHERFSDTCAAEECATCEGREPATAGQFLDRGTS